MFWLSICRMHLHVQGFNSPDAHTNIDCIPHASKQMSFCLTWLQMPMAVERTDVGNSSAV
jgi:hypothetical protein